MITLTTSAKHAMLLDMAKRRAPRQSRLRMLDTIGRQLDEYGTMTSAQLQLCHTTLTSSR
ncbi:MULTISPECIES: hypothetical protein [unclassified Bradyrhizobium]|uniref:hypothetical protein n=1 Tax=unclassified Bradyrhizobium TaxID=2631580 RepID=UPI0029168A10|nr:MULTISPECIES: hypothetical protein [unclassified Bradyrhizobium]